MRHSLLLGFVVLNAACASVPGAEPAAEPAIGLPPAGGIVDRPVYDPASGESPLTLLAVPEDGIAYYDTKLLARRLYRERKYAEVEPLVERLARDPENWRLLAFTKSALKKPLEAVAAYREAGPLIGWDLEFWSGYSMAISYMEAGDRRAALDVLRHMVFDRGGFYRTSLYNWEQFAPLRGDPEFLELVARPDTTGWGRDGGWRYDLDLLVSEVKRVNPDYRNSPFPAEFTRRAEELRREIPTLSDEEIFFRMGRMLAVLRQGHIALWSPPGNRHLPVRFYAFPEGIYIIDADDRHADLVGARVHSIGKLPAEEALRRLAGARSVDGDMQYLWITSWLAQTAFLKGMGAIDSVDAVRLDLRRPGGVARTVTLATDSAPPAGRLDKLTAPRGVTAPLFLGTLEQSHWERALPEHNALYVQVNNLNNDQDETLAAFGRRLWDVLEASRPKHLILDLRHNNGGTTQQYPELLRTLTAFSRAPGNQLYVLIGRRTYSAAGNFVTDLERLTAPIFVGEASSECCNLYGDPMPVQLPYSGIQGELTAYKWQLSSPGDRRREMSPHVPVQLTAEAYFAGRDPALEAIFRMIAASRK